MATLSGAGRGFFAICCTSHTLAFNPEEFRGFRLTNGVGNTMSSRDRAGPLNLLMSTLLSEARMTSHHQRGVDGSVTQCFRHQKSGVDISYLQTSKKNIAAKMKKLGCL